MDIIDIVFFCSVCFKPLTATTVVCKEGVLFCLEHGGVKPPEQPTEPEKPKEYCAGCEKELGERRLSALNKKWHKECFVCRLCKGSISEGYFERQGFPYCSNCKDKVPSNKPIDTAPHDKPAESKPPEAKPAEVKHVDLCPACNQPLGPKRVSALDKKWHPECFVCTLCKGSVASGFVERGGHPYCLSCKAKVPLHQAPPSQPTANPTETKPPEESVAKTKPAEPKTVETKPPEAKPAEVTGDVCPACEKPLGPKRVSAMDKKWHPECFVCHVCKGNLADGFFERDNRPICGPCKKQATAAAPQPAQATAPSDMCPSCNKPLGPKRVSAMDKKWHPECFVCQKCRAGLDDGFYERKGLPYCGTCVKEIPK